MSKLTEILISIDEDWSICTGGGRCQDSGGIYDSDLDRHVMDSEQVAKLEQAIIDWIDKEIIGEDELVDLSGEASNHEFDLYERAKETNNKLRAEMRKKLGR